MNDKTPNILFIMADDIGWNDVGYHGSPIRTPNIDRLVVNGVELDQHYACAVCTPTRAAFMTGRHPGRFGVHATNPTNHPVIPDDYETLAHALKNAGYDTALFGKWHLGSDPKYGPNAFGFDTSYGSLAGGVDPYNHRYKNGSYTYTWHRNGERVDESGHASDLIVREAIDWIETRERPWFCYVPFTAVHLPVNAPEEWIDQYWYETFDEDPERDLSFKRYAAYASHMDHCIGKLIETLKRLCQFDNTIVVFTSDHGARVKRSDFSTLEEYPGWHWQAPPRLGSNDPLRGQKSQLYEGGIRTPTVISWPGVLQPGFRKEALHIADWKPTFTSLVGCTRETDQELDGMDIWPVITGSSTSFPERILYWNVRGETFGVRRRNWKLIAKADQPEASELFDLDADPLETRNLAEKHPDTVEELLGILAEERAKDNTFKRPDVTVTKPSL